MYKVYYDDVIIHDLSQGLSLIDGTIDFEDNSAGGFTFTIPPMHPAYSSLIIRKGTITVKKGDEVIFCGRAITDSKDFYKNREFFCEGELNYLMDSYQRPEEFHNVSVLQYFSHLIEVHNAQMPDKAFEVGMVTVADPNDSLYRYTDYDSTLKTIQEDLLKPLGGHIRVRYEDGKRYIDYLADYPRRCQQEVRFGKNLLDFVSENDLSDVFSALIPLGAKLEDSDERLTIESVNDGSDTLIYQPLIDRFGYIVRTETWDDVTVASNLKRKGEEFLKAALVENLSLDVTAIDLKNAGLEDTDSIKLLDEIRVVSEPHGLDAIFPVSKMTIPLSAPADQKFSLGLSVTNTFTGGSVEGDTAINDKLTDLDPDKLLEQAQQNATNIINATTKGYIWTTADELLIMDTPNPETALKLWRWNLGGLGYSKNGYNGTFETAITMDGGIIGSFIVTGTLSAENVQIGWNKISNYITIKDGYLNFFTNTGGTRLVKRSGKDGDLYYRQNTAGENYEVGVIGTGNYANNDDYGGISFAVRPTGKYMGWFHKKTDAGNVEPQMIYFADSTYYQQGIQLFCNFYANNYLFLGEDIHSTFFEGGGGFTGSGKLLLSSSTEAALQCGGVSFVARSGGLEAFGNINMNGFQITNQSDARLKENITDTSGGLEKVNAVNVYNFDWIDGKKNQTGFIAQQVQEEIPEAVIENNGILTLAYDKLFPYLWQAVKELSQKIGVPYVRSSWRDPYTSEEKMKIKPPRPPQFKELKQEAPKFTMEAKDDE